MGSQYQTLPVEHLIIFGIYSLTNKGQKCTFEQLVDECFNLFPKVFSLNRHPQWPDSLKFDRPLRKLREKEWVIGNSQAGFFLTKFGEGIAKDVKNQSSGYRPEKIIAKTVLKGTDAKLLKFLRESELYKQYLKRKNNFVAKEIDLRRLLRCTLETPIRILKQNLQYIKNLAKEYGDDHLLNFLEFYEKKLK